MDLAADRLAALLRHDALMRRHSVRVRVLGCLGLLPAHVQRAAARAMAATARHTGPVVNICLAYTGSEDMRQSAAALRSAVAGGLLAPGDVSEALLQAALHTRECPPVGLLIRTSGERLAPSHAPSTPHPHAAPAQGCGSPQPATRRRLAGGCPTSWAPSPRLRCCASHPSFGRTFPSSTWSVRPALRCPPPPLRGRGPGVLSAASLAPSGCSAAPRRRAGGGAGAVSAGVPQAGAGRRQRVGVCGSRGGGGGGGGGLCGRHRGKGGT